MDQRPQKPAAPAPTSSATSRLTVSLFKQDGDPDPSLVHSFKQHWPNILPVVRKLIANDPNISPSEWQDLFHEIHMICSWDTKGCFKLIEALENEIRKSHIAKTKTKLASIMDGQQQLRAYIECWSDYCRLCQSIPTAFQQLDLAAKDILPQPRLSSPTSHEMSPSSDFRNYYGRPGPVKNSLLRLWDCHIVEPLERQLQDPTKQDNNNVSVKNDSIMESRCPELLANYCDLILRRNAFSKKFSSLDIIDRFMGILAVLKFVRDKELFLRFYRYHLIRRLIQDATFDLDLEMKFVEYLKPLPKMPNEPIFKFIRMIKDIKSSEQFILRLEDKNDQEKPNCTKDANDKRRGNIRVKVLNPAAWFNNSEVYSIRLPEVLISYMSEYNKQYNVANEGRHIEWCNQLSNGVITFQTNNGSYELHVNAAQLSILYAFNDKPQESQSIMELAQSTELSPRELKKNLLSLVSNRKLDSPIINCEPKLTSFADLANPSNKFSINHDFALMEGSKLKPKGRVNLIGQLPLKQERDYGSLNDSFVTDIKRVAVNPQQQQQSS